jgi:hypothetical protein
MHEELLNAAVSIVRGGWPVFPAEIYGKRPVVPRGFKAATTDLPCVRNWWEGRYAGSNIGVPTGYPGPDVLDVDQRPDGSGWAALSQLRDAGLLAGAFRIVRTPSGGWHVYFAGTGQRCGSLKAAHLDFKCVGGYVIAPPSQVRVWTGRPGSVCHLPEWLAGQPEGNRNAALYWAACRAGERGDEGVLQELVSAAVAAGLDEAEARRTAASAVRTVNGGR